MRRTGAGGEAGTRNFSFETHSNWGESEQMTVWFIIVMSDSGGRVRVVGRSKIRRLNGSYERTEERKENRKGSNKTTYIRTH